MWESNPRIYTLRGSRLPNHLLQSLWTQQSYFNCQLCDKSEVLFLLPILHKKYQLFHTFLLFFTHNAKSFTHLPITTYTYIELDCPDVETVSLNYISIMFSWVPTDSLLSFRVKMFWL